MTYRGLEGRLSRRSLLRATAALGAGLTVGPLLGRRAFAGTPGLKTVNEGFITIAMSGSMPMTGYKDGIVTGSDAEMVVAIAAKLGLGVKPAVMAWSATIEAIKTGRADIMCGNMSWSKKRADVLALTDPIYYAGYFVTMRKDAPFKGESIGIEDIKGHSIGTGTGYDVIPDLKKIPGTTEVKIYDTDDGCIRDVAAGRLDYAVLDGPEVEYMMAKNPSLGLRQVPIRPAEGYSNVSEKDPAVMGMSLENPDLFDAVNAGVAWLWRSKTNAALMVKNGIASPDYMVPPAVNPRLGVDRDEKGNILGAGAHTPKDFSAFFA